MDSSRGQASASIVRSACRTCRALSSCGRPRSTTPRAERATASTSCGSEVATREILCPNTSAAARRT
eukprot:9769184-Alexandrium_andersonii.AAC.1